MMDLGPDYVDQNHKDRLTKRLLRTQLDYPVNLQPAA